MTCYFRHIQQVFEKVRVKITSENKREIDRVIHGIVGVEYSNCPAVWREMKERLAKDEKSFVLELKEALSKKDNGFIYKGSV